MIVFWQILPRSIGYKVYRLYTKMKVDYFPMMCLSELEGKYLGKFPDFTIAWFAFGTISD